MFDPKNLPPETAAREPIFRIPPATASLALLLTGIWAFLALASYGAVDQILMTFGFLPERLVAAATGQYPLAPALWPLVTHLFLHVDGLHLATNVGFLIAFASPYERQAGVWRFLAVFLISGIMGALFQLLLSSSIEAQGTLLIGASGGVFGLMGAVLPQSRDALRGGFAIGRVIVVLMAINLVIGLLSEVGLFGGIRIGWQAHLGGFLAGLALGWGLRR